MRIGIDARFYRREAAGLSTYTQNLLAELLRIGKNDQWYLFLTPKDAKECKIRGTNIIKVVTPIAHYTLTEQLELPRALAQWNLDLVHFLNFNHPVRYRGKFVVTIHDLTLMLYPGPSSNPLKRLGYRYVFSDAARRAQKIIAVSEFTKSDLGKHFPRAKGKTVVIPEAAAPLFFSEPAKTLVKKLKNRYHLGSDQHILLAVGQWRKHKNIPTLLQALAQLRFRFGDTVKLVLVGTIDPRFPEIPRLIRTLHLIDTVILTGFIDEESLLAWYSLAKCFVFPSFYEGFGLPGIEAMAAGVPVAASQSSALPEVYGNAAVYFDPESPDDIASKITRIIRSKTEQKRLRTKGRARARHFSWKEAAMRTYQVYREVVYDN